MFGFVRSTKLDGTLTKKECSPKSQTKNPDIDLDHFLQGANPIFRKFIDDGLAELENTSVAAARSSDSNSNKILSENRFSTHKESGDVDPDYWMERLNLLKVSNDVAAFR